MHTKKNLSVMLLIVITIATVLFWPKSPVPTEQLTANERKVMDEKMGNYTPRCIGRYLIDLPEDFVFKGGLTMINDKQIETQRMYLPAFEQRIRLREKELQELKPIHTINSPFLKKIYKLPAGMNGVIFEYASSEIAPDAFRNLEGHVYDNGVAFKLIIDAVNADGERYAEERNNEPDVYYNNVDRKVHSMISFLGRLQGREADVIPKSKGLCIPNGIIEGTSDEKEEVSFSYQSSANSNVYVNIETNNFLQEDHSMLERSSDISSVLSREKMRTIMKGYKKINGLEAEEWLTVGLGDDVLSGHNFILNINEKHGDYKSPFLRVNMMHGPLPDQHLSEKEIHYLWQKIIETTRIRSNAI